MVLREERNKQRDTFSFSTTDFRMERSLEWHMKATPESSVNSLNYESYIFFYDSTDKNQ